MKTTFDHRARELCAWARLNLLHQKFPKDFTPVTAIVKRTCTRARERFLEAEKFNQPLDKWSDRLGEVTHMEAMFYEATDFNQDLGWCLATGVSVGSMFLDTKCGSLSGCGVTQSGSCPP